MTMIFKRSFPVEYIIAGLGNPGRQYDSTRHNTGFRALDFFAENKGIRVTKANFRGLTGDGCVCGKKVLLLKPQTFMNESGISVRAAADFYKLPPERVIIVFDDVALDPGVIRVKRNGSDGGHNGVKSIIEHMGTQEFPRVKIGVGSKPHPEMDLADHVLGTPNTFDMKAIAGTFPMVSDVLSLMIDDNIELAMREANVKNTNV